MPQSAGSASAASRRASLRSPSASGRSCTRSSSSGILNPGKGNRVVTRVVPRRRKEMRLTSAARPGTGGRALRDPGEAVRGRPGVTNVPTAKQIDPRHDERRSRRQHARARTCAERDERRRSRTQAGVGACGRSVAAGTETPGTWALPPPIPALLRHKRHVQTRHDPCVLRKPSGGECSTCAAIWREVSDRRSGIFVDQPLVFSSRDDLHEQKFLSSASFPRISRLAIAII